jgi:biopolymer transport protein ExbD
MRFPHNTKVFRGQLDAAPFAGVFFLLVLLLLLHTGLVFIPGVPIRLPEGAALPGTDRPSAVVAVDRHGNFYFENQLCDETRLRERLLAALARSKEPLTLVVQADRQASVEVIARLGLLAQSVGIRELWQAVRPNAAPTPAGAPVRP